MDTVVRSAPGAPFVARAQHLAHFELSLARARAGEPGALLLSGDAGVGKTRLLSRMAEIAERDGALVVTGHCIDLGDVGLPYLPFTDALGQLRAATDTVERALAARPALGRLLDGGLADGREGGESQAARLQLFDGIAAVLGAVGTAERPLLVMLEDLHWADPSSRDVLRFLLARLRSEHLLVVGSYRTDDLHRQHPLRPVLAELLRHPKVDHLELPAFTHDELAEFAEAVTGRPLREATLHSVFTRSEGNAYFAQEILEAGPDAAVLPGSLADVLHGRLERLDPGVQALARIASVSGRRVSEPLLWAVAAHDSRFPDTAAFDRALREAVTHHVLAAEDSRWIAFRHALLAEAVYADLLPGELAGLHAAYLRELLADPTLGSQAQVAHHALRSHHLPAALAASHAAAREAAEVLAPAEELRHLETVLQLWDAVPGAAELIGRDRIEVTIAAAATASRAGQPTRAGALALAALAEADPQRAARITPSAVSQLLHDDRASQALAAAERALAVLENDPPSPERARVYAAHARAALNLDCDEDARRTAEKAITEARLLGVADAEADALTTLAVLHVDDADRAAALLRGAVDTARRTGDLLGELRGLHNLSANRYYAGRLAQAEEVLDGGIAQARATGVLWTGYGVEMLILRQLIRYVNGDLTPAPPSADWVPESATWILSVVDLYGAVARGDADAVERGRAAQADWQRDPMAALISGGCTIDALTWRGEHQPAVDLTMQVIEYMNAAWNDYFLGGIWLSALGLAALADRAEQTRLTGGDTTADIAIGTTLLDRAVETARRGRPRGGRLGPEGRAWLARAHAEHGRLVGEDDPARWAAVVEEFGYGYRYEMARARWRMAASLAAAGDPARARSEALTALAEAVETGAQPLADALRDLGRRARLDLPGSRQAVAVLTDREEAVLALVAQGLTNRQVGERLFISSKTVSVHMSNVLAKLGVSGRAEAVAVAHRRGLLAGERTG